MVFKQHTLLSLHRSAEASMAAGLRGVLFLKSFNRKHHLHLAGRKEPK